MATLAIKIIVGMTYWHFIVYLYTLISKITSGFVNFTIIMLLKNYSTSEHNIKCSSIILYRVVLDV